jgi:hypothetical protein
MVFAFLVGSVLVPTAPPAQASGTAVNDVPTALIGSGVTSYAMAAPKIFWYTGVPPCPPAIANSNNGPTAAYTELVRRIATYGNPVRTLYSEGRDCNQGQVLSNIIADADYIYWLGPIGLMRLSTNANPGNAPELMNALVSAPGELADGGDRIDMVNNNTGGSNTEISYVLKAGNHAHVHLTSPGNYAGNIQADDSYVYYLVSGTLYRLNPGVDSGVSIATGVSGYYPEGTRFGGCVGGFCFRTNIVYIAKGRSVYRYNNLNNTLGPAIYTSLDSTASVYQLVTDASNLYLFESRLDVCDLFCSYTDVLNRTTRSGGSVDALYSYGPDTSGPIHLTTDNTFLFWQENSAVMRLPNNAGALPLVNVYVTGIEVTQGIQNLSNSVKLVNNRRTFVRVYVKSAGGSVPGVTAQLSTRTLVSNPLLPVNTTGTTITVRAIPDRNDLNQSFLFELPWDWTQQSSLDLNVNVNPYKIPLETNYADNTSGVTVNFLASPSLSVEFFRLNYKIGNTTYTPRITEDVLKTYSWILRAYPLGGSVGDNFKPRLWDVDGGTYLGSLVNRTNPKCSQAYPNPKDDVSLCASYYMNGWLLYYRVATQMGVLNIGLKTNAFYYGMITDASNNFPRGQAMYPLTSVGPAGTPGQFFNLGNGWDTDGSYADWYAAHEIGHSLGRAHPNAGSDDPATPDTTENCGHSRSDPGFPYGNTSTARAPIGPADGSMEGFDSGDPSFGIARAVLPSSTWNDVMSYCSNQWISNYTYTGMYNYMLLHPSQLVSVDSAQPQVSGNFLLVSGLINPTAKTAGFSLIRRLSSVVDIPALIPGDYSIRLLNSKGKPLADYAFTPDAENDSSGLSFGQVVNFVAGTSKIELIHLSDNHVLAAVLVSAHAPVISKVALKGAPNPVTGVVNLTWNASDADGDPLTFDVAYSRDGGATFQPVANYISGTSTQIDTAQLGGSGTAILQVTASDGVNNASAISASFVMANKPPQPYILDPGDNTQIHYGQLVNFSGVSLDAQDSLVASSGLVWKNALGTVLGTGPTLSLTSLPVGTNVITLKATDSVGQSASTTVKVIVDDDLTLPGPTLIAGPLQVGWQVPAGTTQLQTANVSISNGGSGSLDWTASSDQTWLKISAPGGTVSDTGDPSTLTLTAHPTGLANNKTFIAHVTLTKPASGGYPPQTVEILVTLGIGDVHVSPVKSFAGHRVFMPMLNK